MLFALFDWSVICCDVESGCIYSVWYWRWCQIHTAAPVSAVKHVTCVINGNIKNASGRQNRTIVIQCERIVSIGWSTRGVCRAVSNQWWYIDVFALLTLRLIGEKTCEKWKYVIIDAEVDDGEDDGNGEEVEDDDEDEEGRDGRRERHNSDASDIGYAISIEYVGYAARCVNTIDERNWWSHWENKEIGGEEEEDDEDAVKDDEDDVTDDEGETCIYDCNNVSILETGSLYEITSWIQFCEDCKITELCFMPRGT